MCRICHCEGELDLPLLSPCYCAGSLRWVHQQCLEQWIKSSDAKCCELCKFPFLIHTELKPFRKWKKLEMSPAEHCKVLCSITFHVVTITCVVVSVYGLIKQTAKEMSAGVLDWTNVILVSMVIPGGLFYIYGKYKKYEQLYCRWRAFNSNIYVQNAPGKGGTHQQGEAVFNAAAQLTANILANEERLSPEKEEFRWCQSGFRNSSHQSTNEAGDAKHHLQGPLASAAETGASKTTLTSVTDSLIPAEDQHDTLSEVVVVDDEIPSSQQTTPTSRIQNFPLEEPKIFLKTQSPGPTSL